jgi:hypothetical protein
MINDLCGKFLRGDWHGVSDAANDLRELEAKHPQLKGEAQWPAHSRN